MMPSGRVRADTSSVGRQPLVGDDQRMVPPGLERHAQAREHATAVVLDRRTSCRAAAPAPARRCRHTPSRSPDAPGTRRAAGVVGPNRRITSMVTPASSGPPRPRRDHDVARRQPGNLVQRHLVVAPHHRLRTQLAQVLHQVVGERVVVIENENHSEVHSSLRPRHSGFVDLRQSRHFVIRPSSPSVHSLRALPAPAPGLSPPPWPCPWSLRTPPSGSSRPRCRRRPGCRPCRWPSRRCGW